MEDQNLHHISTALYQYMCQHIVGSEEAVKTKRLLMAIYDNLSSDKFVAYVTSGSYGEGLEMKGSDFDFMDVKKYLQVYENVSEIQWNPVETYFAIVTENTKPGFVKLLLLYSRVNTYVSLCVESKGRFYLSNQLIKGYLELEMSKGHIPYYATEVNHGPCLSDKKGRFDFAICVHLKSWIRQAEHWMKRPNSSWPSDDVKSNIIEHGVLFVPIGVKASPNEEIEWRISFSVGEKILINSFTHTQLLCYALMKIILKDVINTDERCKDLLCSYYIKNILFWVSEELPLSAWKPHNLISCFMRCFRRLIYCTQYSLCPHYFIPEINMFENKIEGYSRRMLLDSLNTLYGLDWKCILFSPQLQDFIRTPCLAYTDSQLFISYFERINLSAVLLGNISRTEVRYNRYIKMISDCTSSRSKSYYQYNFSKLCQRIAEADKFTDGDDNRQMYKNYKLRQSYLLQNLHHDAVSGWLCLASLFYRMRQYRRALDILFYALSKFSQEKMLLGTTLSCAQREILKSKTLQSKGLVSILKFLCLEDVLFDDENSLLIPKEIELESQKPRYFCSIPPVVFAHFLSFLCNFHLNDARQFRHSLEDLQLTISEEYFIFNSNFKSISYTCLGIAFQLVGDTDLARQAYHNAIRLDPVGMWSSAKMRLAMIDAD